MPAAEMVACDIALLSEGRVAATHLTWVELVVTVLDDVRRRIDHHIVSNGVTPRAFVNVVRDKLRDWISWAARSRLPPFKKLAGTLRNHFKGVLAFVATGLTNGPIEGLNGKIRTITRRAYGFQSAASLISLIFLCCTGLTLHPVFKSPNPHPLHG